MKLMSKRSFAIIHQETVEDLREELVLQPQQDYILPGRSQRHDIVERLVINANIMHVPY